MHKCQTNKHKLASTPWEWAKGIPISRIHKAMSASSDGCSPLQLCLRILSCWPHSRKKRFWCCKKLAYRVRYSFLFRHCRVFHKELIPPLSKAGYVCPIRQLRFPAILLCIWRFTLWIVWARAEKKIGRHPLRCRIISLKRHVRWRIIPGNLIRTKTPHSSCPGC
jgi:hypothetical protein